MRITKLFALSLKRSLLLCMVMIVSGCWNVDRETSTMYGAAGGALVGGGFGCAFAGNLGGHSRDFAIGCPTGVVAGAVIGGLLGYAFWGPPPTVTAPAKLPSPAPTPAPSVSAQVPRVPTKQKIVLRGVYFDFNKAVIRPGDAATLDEAASALKTNASVAVDVNGYCDSVGSEEYNLKLSDRRANAVVDYLVKQGIRADRLISHGYGKTNFVASNDTAEGRAQNRRVELIPVGNQ